MYGKNQEARFPETDWNEIQAAADPSTSQGHEALNRVLDRYRRPLLTHLTGKFSLKSEDADDLLHGFIHEKIIVECLLRRAKSSRGRFRTFILNALDNYVLTTLRRQCSLKRRPKGQIVPIHDVAEKDLPQHQDKGHEGVEIVWAQAVIAGALLNMRAELARRGRLETWSLFEHRVLLPILDDQPPLGYGELVQRFGFKSPSEAFNVLVTAKRMFQRHLTSVIAEYASNDREVEEELANLRNVLQTCSLSKATRTALEASNTPAAKKKGQRAKGKTPRAKKKAPHKPPPPNPPSPGPPSPPLG